MTALTIRHFGQRGATDLERAGYRVVRVEAPRYIVEHEGVQSFKTMSELFDIIDAVRAAK